MSIPPYEERGQVVPLQVMKDHDAMAAGVLGQPFRKSLQRKPSFRAPKSFALRVAKTLQWGRASLDPTTNHAGV